MWKYVQHENPQLSHTDVLPRVKTRASLRRRPMNILGTELQCVLKGPYLVKMANFVSVDEFTKIYSYVNKMSPTSMIDASVIGC